MKKTTPVILLFSLLLFACNSDKPDEKVKEDVQKTMDDINTSVSVEAKEGRGKIVLQCNGNTYEINGVCGAVSAMGTMTVAVKDDNIPVKVFTVSFNSDQLPATSSTYNIVKSSLNQDNDPTHITVGFTDMRSALPMIWESDKNSGKLDFVVNGEEIKCSFSNLVLQPNNFYNKEAQNKPATVSGEFTFYKK